MTLKVPARGLRLGAKLTAIYSILVLFVSLVLTLSLYLEVRQAQQDAIRERLGDIVSFSAPLVDGAFHARVQEPLDENTAFYTHLAARLRSIRDTSHVIERIYTLRQLDDGSLVYVVDVDPLHPARVGQAYERISPALTGNLSTLIQPVVEDDIYADETGTYLSAYAPIYNQFGEVDGVLGIDIDASTVAASEWQATRNALLAFLITAPTSILVVILAARYVVRPLLQLNTAAKALAAGRWQKPVQIASADELGELARSFNSMAAQLTNLVATLEERVAERTRDLKIASDVARQITTVLDLDILLPRLVEQTKKGFDLYYASVYLYEPDTKLLYLAAGAGKAGQAMKATGEARGIDEHPSLTALAARERHSIVVGDVSQSSDYLPHECLPHTQSEAALPMLVGDELIGVLDLQSDQKDRFTQNEVGVLTTLAEQIGIAVKNAQLYAVQVHAAEQLRSADRIKSQFLATMSHELRTPLNAILIFTEMLSLGMAGPVTPEQKDMLDKSLSSARHLLNLINDVLDMSKIQAGMLTLFIEEDIDLVGELNEVADTGESLISSGSGVQLVRNYDNNLPTISGDKRRIRQVLLNLVSNAAKFTSTGTITLSARAQADAILISVVDTGPGIPKEQQEKIFEAFIQSETGLKHGSGTGLGLAISRRLVEAHGGRLWVESEPGQGAAFFVELPQVVTYHPPDDEAGDENQ